MARIWAGWSLLVCCTVLLSGCLSTRSYVDPVLPAADKSGVKPAARVEPIQALFEYRTRGAPNSGVTQRLSPTALGVLRDSGLFSQVSETPVANGRRLVITIDNVPITSESDAKMKGFGTGLTFGLVGTMVTDGFVCESTYTSPTGATVKSSYKHALHSTIGNASGPPGLVGKSTAEAMKDITTQLTWSVLRDLSRNEGFAQ